MDRFARRVFTIAGVYGLIVLVPQLFSESRIARDFPPAITHPEYFYGFLGVAIDFDPASGRLSIDERFRDPGSNRAGISLAGSNWPRGYNGSVVPHGAVFSTH